MTTRGGKENREKPDVTLWLARAKHRLLIAACLAALCRCPYCTSLFASVFVSVWLFPRSLPSCILSSISRLLSLYYTLAIQLHWLFCFMTTRNPRPYVNKIFTFNILLYIFKYWNNKK